MSIKRFISTIIPKPFELPMRYFYGKCCGKLDFELPLLKSILLNKGKCGRMVDIGANIGIYSYYFAKYCKHIEAFEPILSCASVLDCYPNKRIRVHNVALSNCSGEAELHVPLSPQGKALFGLSSIREQEGKIKCVKVPRHKLDDYNFSDVSLIKIDVEGHELEVIEGAKETILRCKPFIFVEIEQRHLLDRTINDIFNFILGLGYEGGFYKQTEYCQLSEFSYEIHQKPFLDDLESNCNMYINNFLFKPINL